MEQRGALTVHIESLELVGVPAGQRYAVADAMVAELTRQLAERMPRASSTLVADAGQLAPQASPRALGRAVATAVLDALDGRDRR